MKKRITVSPGAVLLWTAIYFFDSGGMFPLLVTAAAFHELSHIAAILWAGGSIEGLSITVTGMEILCRTELLSYGREFVCAMAGPVGSIVLAVAASVFGFYTLAGISLVLGLYNLLPIGFLDGGRMLYCAVSGIKGCESGERAGAAGGMAVSAALCLAGVRFRLWRLLYFAVITGICCCKYGAKGVKSKDKDKVKTAA